MIKISPIAISISRQFGSGGGLIGSRLAKRLGFLYMDREIVMETAKKLNVPYEEIASYDESYETFWGSLLTSFQYGDYSFTPAEYVPSDEIVHRAESEIILEAAKSSSIVVVGRGANFVLKEEPNLVSIYVHGDEASRVERVKKAFQANQQESLKMMQKTDALRENYVQKFLGHSSYDLRYYDLTLDTTHLSLEKTEELIIEYLKLRFGEEVIQGYIKAAGAQNE